MLRTMPDLTWKVRVDKWTWLYTFSSRGTVTWKDPFNGMHGSGGWRISGNKMVTRWNGSKTIEKWDVPINPLSASGVAYMEAGTFDLWAEAQNFYLKPGDVVRSGGKKYVIYDDEVRSGGTVSWVCRNPGNIRNGDRHGAFPGKKYQTQSVGAFAIFPDEATGMSAIAAVLRGYGNVTVLQAMNKYAPAGDGANDPNAYGRTLAHRLGVRPDTHLPQLSDDQITKFAEEIKRVEGWKPGDQFSRDDPRLPDDDRQRLGSHPYPPTEDEIRNSSLLTPW